MAEIPSIYRVFFLYIEPISLLAGSFIAGRPLEYLSLLTLKPTPLSDIPDSLPVKIALYQLSNLYLLLAINEHFILKSSSRGTWRTMLAGLLFADILHILTHIPLGPDAFYKFWEWNSMLWGGVGFVYLCALLRAAFLFNIGFPNREKEKAK